MIPYNLLRYTRAIIMAITAAFLLSLTLSCSNTELWDDLPAPITNFINQYFPSSELESVQSNSTTIHVRIKDGPGMTFASTGDNPWEAVNGYGMPLPQVLLFDQLPPKIYQYLQETEQLNSVFAIARDDKTYTITLLNDTLSYTIADETLTTVL